MRSADARPNGITFATGFPCLVTTMPSGPKWSRMDRHCSLNFAAAIFFMTTTYNWTHNVSSKGGFALIRVSGHAREVTEERAAIQTPGAQALGDREYDLAVRDAGREQ